MHCKKYSSTDMLFCCAACHINYILASRQQTCSLTQAQVLLKENTKRSMLLGVIAGASGPRGSPKGTADPTQDIVMLQALPFLIETPSQKAHKTSLERRLQEIEEANKVFSRIKVLVEI